MGVSWPAGNGCGTLMEGSSCWKLLGRGGVPALVVNSPAGSTKLGSKSTCADGRSTEDRRIPGRCWTDPNGSESVRIVVRSRNALLVAMAVVLLIRSGEVGRARYNNYG
ncbi:hypothetical protein DAPPUDRAFT_238883 [Daphnia pulex]|uniref:Uncharacterized protein n=1 Tax=Daphnia pulex TaxID=6669 RepID=E9G7P1_DAPPU|nr:hypothetical protein DAPPUDRAFT_238883 [Daphnia pulex]|eukprot:EFX84510.1 hypothetical protein DAPPUDRAFT_238883 [Daphnia pulex]